MCADLAYHVDTAAVVQDGLDGLSSFRMVWKPRLHDKRTCMIDTDLMVISDVNSSRKLGCTVHEVITFTMRGTACRGCHRCI